MIDIRQKANEIVEQVVGFHLNSSESEARAFVESFLSDFRDSVIQECMEVFADDYDLLAGVVSIPLTMENAPNISRAKRELDNVRGAIERIKSLKSQPTNKQ